MMHKILLLCAVFLFCGSINIVAASPIDFRAGDVGGFSDYKINYQLVTRQGLEETSMAVAVVERNKFRIDAGFIDGGGITRHSLAITAVVKTEEDTVIDLLLTLDGQPNKALFGARLTADVTTSAPGRYRVRLWLLEKFHDAGKQMLGESVVILSDK